MRIVIWRFLAHRSLFMRRISFLISVDKTEGTSYTLNIQHIYLGKLRFPTSPTICALGLPLTLTSLAVNCWAHGLVHDDYVPFFLSSLVIYLEYMRATRGKYGRRKWVQLQSLSPMKRSNAVHWFSIPSMIFTQPFTYETSKTRNCLKKKGFWI